MSSIKSKTTRPTKPLDVVHSGMVLLSDGKGHGTPARLILTKEMLTIQFSSAEEENAGPPQATTTAGTTQDPADATVRVVTLEKTKEGLGMSIKGGTDGSTGQVAPVVVSKIIPRLAAHRSGAVSLGDRILEVDGTTLAGLTHEEVVRLLREAPGPQVSLVVQHEAQLAAVLRRSPSKNRWSGSYADSTLDGSYTGGGSILKGALKSPSVEKSSRFNSIARDDDLRSTAWKTISRLPLPMAIVTRYLWGTDKMRQNAFELRTVDGRQSGIIHCEDDKALEQWVRYCEHHIDALNRKSIKMSNKYLHPSEHITYIGWVEERMPDGYFEDPKIKWEQRFLILKGSDLCIFETPPLNSEELDRCVCLYKVYETALRTVARHRDRRPYVLLLEACQGTSHYIATQSLHQLQQIESAYYNSVYKAITAVQTRTFACSFDGRPAGLVLDFKQGVSLYDIPTKKYVWQFGFDELIASSDDGKIRLELGFRDFSRGYETTNTKDIECDQVMAVVYTLHSFFIALMMGVDPEFLKATPLD